MKNYINKYSFNQLSDLLLNKIVHFESKCQLFPNFNIKGKVLSLYYASNGEIIITISHNYKKYKIGANTPKLTFEIK